jgi:hypothetical protein
VTLSGKYVTVAQHDHYRHRGLQLHAMKFDEYCPGMVIVPIPKEGPAFKTEGAVSQLSV